MKRLVLLTFLAAPLALAWLPARAQTSPAAAPEHPASCMSPLPADGPDPDVRDVHIHLTSDPRYVGVTMCVVSNETNGFANITGNISLFAGDGSLINSATNTYANVAPLVGAGGSGPKVILPFAAAVYVDPKYHDDLATQVLVTLQATPCQEKLPACKPDVLRSATFPLSALIDHDQAAPPRR
jgi:hypothetical protein